MTVQGAFIVLGRPLVAAHLSKAGTVACEVTSGAAARACLAPPWIQGLRRLDARPDSHTDHPKSPTQQMAAQGKFAEANWPKRPESLATNQSANVLARPQLPDRARHKTIQGPVHPVSTGDPAARKYP